MFTISFDLYLIGVVVAASVILGFVIYFQNQRSITNLLFLVFTLVSSFWSIANYISYYLKDEFWTLVMVRLVMFFAVFQALSFFLLVYVFPKEKLKLPKFISLVVIPTTSLVALLTLTPFVFSGVKILPGNIPQPIPATGILFFAFVAISLVVWGIVILVKGMRLSDGKLKSQYKYLLLGLLMMFFLIILCNFILPTLLGISTFIPLGAVFIFPFIASTSYAIARYELLNIRIVGTEVLTFVLIIVTFFEIILSSDLSEVLFRSFVFIGLVIFGVLFIRSVVNEVKQKEKLAELNEKLKAMDEQKDTFISMAAHELRAPMTAIKGYISMVLEGDTGDIPEKARGFLADASNITDRLVRLVNNMLNVSKIEEGRMVYQTEVENLSQVVRTVFNQFTPEAHRKGLEYTLEIPPEVKDRVKVDPDRIQEVIGNLLSNAIKYTERGSVKVRLKQAGKDSVRFEVEDTGPGISEAEQTKLFQKFQRAESTIGKTTGTGLGLYICKLLVEKFNGKVGVKSKPGVGSTFWFELPLVSSM